MSSRGAQQAIKRPLHAEIPVEDSGQIQVVDMSIPENQSHYSRTKTLKSKKDGADSPALEDRDGGGSLVNQKNTEFLPSISNQQDRSSRGDKKSFILNYSSNLHQTTSNSSKMQLPTDRRVHLERSSKVEKDEEPLNIFVKKDPFNPLISHPSLPLPKGSGVDHKLANLITVMQSSAFKSMTPHIQTVFRDLFDYAQQLESAIKQKDEEITRLLFLNKYHFKIQENKDQMFTKIVEQNRNIVEENKRTKKLRKALQMKANQAETKRKKKKSTSRSRKPSPDTLSVKSPNKTINFQSSPVGDLTMMQSGNNPEKILKSGSNAKFKFESKLTNVSHGVSFISSFCY
jgi:hypothetical protein